MAKFCRLALIMIVLAGFSHIQVCAQVYPTDFASVLVANGLSNPTAMAHAPDGRIFVAEQGGKLRVIKNNALLPTAFLQLTVNSSGERGLIGIALDPDFSANNYIYLYYTVPGNPAHNRISRFTANGDVEQAGSEFIVLELDPLSTATNHNGGAMHFGKDGKLYVAVGENANGSYAQNLNTYHGKLLRINKDGSVPEGNPFTTGSEQRRRVWAYGLRNPFTFSIHPESGRILVNDVGQVTAEEINDASTGGSNFGWPTTEGNFNPATYPNFTNPIYAYPHGSGDGKGCAITGGTFFYPSVTNYPASYLGKYFFQDLCNRWINTLDLAGATAVRAPFATSIQGNSLALTVGNDGNVYYLSRASGALYKIIYNKTTIPYITNHPASLTIAEGQPGTFNVSALGTTPFEYQWQKNGIDVPGETGATLTIENAVPNDEGEYKVVVSNAAGTATSNGATLTVIENVLPVAKITSPISGNTYAAGTIIEFSGAGSDAEDGELPPAAFRWQINFHHDAHKHDEPPIDGVASGNFLVPTEGETSDNVWYRIILTVTDSRGLVGKDSVDIFPKKSAITLATNPPGLEVTVDGQSVLTPVEIISVEGMVRTFGVDSPQLLEGVEYEFESWSNGGDATQTITTPDDDIQLIANFAVIVGIEKNAQENSVMIYPNPSKEEYITVRIIVTREQELSIRLVNLLSQEISSRKQNLPPGEHFLPFHFGKLSRGIYSVIVKTTEHTAFKRLVIAE